MPNKKYRIVYESKLYNASETMEILKKCPPDVFFKLYHKYKKEVYPSMNNDRTTLSKRLDDLTKLVKDGFTELRQDVKDINARLDYYGLQIEQINKRLDYNGLKRLPESNK